MAANPVGSSRVAQSGAALITSLIMLLVMTLLATTTMNNASLEERMANNAAFRERAFQAAETAAAEAFASARSVYASSMDDPDGVALTLSGLADSPHLVGNATLHHLPLDGTPACGASSIGVGSSGFALRYFEIDADGRLVDGDDSAVAESDVTAGVAICGPS